MAVKPNDVITDGTVEWAVRDIRGGTDGNPVGIILAFAGNGALPDGYLLCDGSAVSRTMYSELFAAIGSDYGDGDGSITFNLPNLFNRFIEGGVRAAYVSPGLPQISGAFTSQQGTISTRAEGAFGNFIQTIYSGMGIGGGLFLDNNIYGKDFYASRSNPIYGRSDTVQPAALVLRYIIKYKI